MATQSRDNTETEVFARADAAQHAGLVNRLAAELAAFHAMAENRR